MPVFTMAMAIGVALRWPVCIMGITRGCQRGAATRKGLQMPVANKQGKGSTRSAKVGTIGKAACAKVAKPGSAPTNLYTLAALVAQLPNQGTGYGSAAALFAAAAPGGYPRTLGTQARGCLRQQGQGVGRGKRHGVSASAWLAAYNATRPNQQVHAS